MQGQSYSFGNAPPEPLQEEQQEFEIEPIVTPEPQEQQEDKKPTVKEETPKEEIQEQNTQEEVPKKPRGESTFATSWKKVWKTILFFMR